MHILKNIIVPVASLFVVVQLSCDIFDDIFKPKDDESIEGSYLLTDYCMGYSQVAGSNPAISIDSILDSANCATSPIKDLVSMSTLIITPDSIIRFGYHCPGDNSGSTRIAYGYSYRDGQLFGDSLSGSVDVGEGTIVKTTYLKKHPDQSITITQVGKLYIDQIDSTLIIVYKGDYDNYDSTYYSYDDEPTCAENYGPWFPIPFW